jgi:hypothetical protein
MWRHRSIADSRPEQLSSSAPEPWPVGQILPLWWIRLPFVAVIAGPGPTVAIARVWYYSSPWYTDVGYRSVQPVPYSHKLHLGEPGLDRRYCHAPVRARAQAADRRRGRAGARQHHTREGGGHRLREASR